MAFRRPIGFDDDAERTLFELYRSGLRTGIRRGVTSQVTEMFRRLWTYHRKFFLDRELPLITSSECWQFTGAAFNVAKKARELYKDGAKAASATEVFDFLKILTSREKDRTGYYLTMAATEPWFPSKKLNLGMKTPRQQFQLLQAAAKQIRKPIDKLEPWRSFIKAGKKKSDGLQSIINAAASAGAQAVFNWEKFNAAAAAILALTEPKLVAPGKASRPVGEFTRAKELTWNSVHPDTSLGRMACAYASQVTNLDKEDVRLLWLGCFVDRDIYFRDDTFWRREYTKNVVSACDESKWHRVAVPLMFFCESWFTQNDCQNLYEKEREIAPVD